MLKVAHNILKMQAWYIFEHMFVCCLCAARKSDRMSIEKRGFYLIEIKKAWQHGHGLLKTTHTDTHTQDILP
jgi:hypothetical protein